MTFSIRPIAFKAICMLYYETLIKFFSLIFDVDMIYLQPTNYSIVDAYEWH